MLEPWTGPFTSDAGKMFSDLTFGQGPKFWNWMNQPVNYFENKDKTGIISNLTNQADMNNIPIGGINQPNVIKSDDGTQTFTGGTTDPSDDITVANLPAQVQQPTMADVAGPSTPTPTPTPTPTKDYDYYANWTPGSGTGWRHGGLASVSRYLKGR